MKNVDYSLNTNMSELENCQKDAAKAAGLTHFTDMRNELLTGGNGLWMYSDNNHTSTRIHMAKVEAEYGKLFGQVTNQSDFRENLNKIYIGGKPYPAMCHFNVNNIDPKIIMMDVMSYVNESAFQKTNKEGKLDNPLVMFKNGNELEPVDTNTKNIKAPFNPITRAWYSLINWISRGSIYKEEVAQIENYDTIKKSQNAKKAQFEINKNYIKEEEIEHKQQEIERQRPEAIKIKEMLEVCKKSMDSFDVHKLDQAFFGDNNYENEINVNKAAEGAGFSTLHRVASRAALGTFAMLASGKTLTQAFDPSDSLHDTRREIGKNIFEMLETKNYDGLYELVAKAGKNLGNETLDMPTSDARSMLTFAGTIHYKCILGVNIMQAIPKTLENYISPQTKEKYKKDFDESRSICSSFSFVGLVGTALEGGLNTLTKFNSNTDKVAIDRMRQFSFLFDKINPQKESVMTIKDLCNGMKQVVSDNMGQIPQAPDNAQEREQFIQQFLSDFALKPSAAPQRELVNLLGEKEAAPKRQPSPEKKKTEMTMTK